MMKILFGKTKEVKNLEAKIEKIKQELDVIRDNNRTVYETGQTSGYIPVGAKYTELFKLMDSLNKLKRVS